MLWKAQVVWDVTFCKRVLDPLNFEDEGATTVRNVGIHGVTLQTTRVLVLQAV